jgi:hypothetical protein
VTKTITTDFRSLVIKSDPDWPRDKRYVVEYEFPAHGGGDDRTHEGQMRVFKGFYDQRGPYDS